ncbi:WXG100 family type VII secretion target [Amycolatopsis minnesotensis]|uniref:WXG100 family type VII secretion target n=1 Tax=Amycolatopsis minnesotensis TaxID=337894 RepID=A0ABP5DLJ9_9PSEU
MSSAGYQSDAAAMTRAVQGFEETASDAKTTMASLETELTETLRSYKGDQAIAFWDLQRALQEKMAAAVRELDTMSSLVNQSFHNYGSGDADVSHQLRQVSNLASDAGGSVLGRLSGAH